MISDENNEAEGAPAEEKLCLGCIFKLEVTKDTTTAAQVYSMGYSSLNVDKIKINE